MRRGVEIHWQSCAFRARPKESHCPSAICHPPHTAHHLLLASRFLPLCWLALLTQGPACTASHASVTLRSHTLQSHASMGLAAPGLRGLQCRVTSPATLQRDAGQCCFEGNNGRAAQIFVFFQRFGAVKCSSQALFFLNPHLAVRIGRPPTDVRVSAGVYLIASPRRAHEAFTESFSRNCPVNLGYQYGAHGRVARFWRQSAQSSGP